MFNINFHFLNNSIKSITFFLAESKNQYSQLIDAIYLPFAMLRIIKLWYVFPLKANL